MTIINTIDNIITYTGNELAMTRTPLNLAINTELLTRFKSLCAARGAKMTAVLTHLMTLWTQNPDHFRDAAANAVASARSASSGVLESAIVAALRQTLADFSETSMRLHSEHLTEKSHLEAYAGNQTDEQKKWLSDERQFWATHPMRGYMQRYPDPQAPSEPTSAASAPPREIEPAPTPAEPANSPPPDDSADEMW